MAPLLILTLVHLLGLPDLHSTERGINAPPLADPLAGRIALAQAEQYFKKEGVFGATTWFCGGMARGMVMGGDPRENPEPEELGWELEVGIGAAVSRPWSWAQCVFRCR